MRLKRLAGLTGMTMLSASLTACVIVAGHVNGAMSGKDLDRARSEIIATMDASARAWTHGDLDGFMKSYADGNVTYVTSRGVIRGRDAIRATYAPRFAPGARHDSLSFENVEMDLQRPDAAWVLAFYRLSRGDSTVARGPTSLEMVRYDDGTWHIVHDHSS